MGKEVEVRTKLTLDDLTTSVLKRVEDQFKATDAAQKEAQEGASEFASTFAAQFAAVNLAPAIDKVVELTKSFFRAGVEAQQGDKAVAGMVAAAQGATWDNAMAAAGEYGDRLDEIALRAHRAGGDVGDAFQRMIEITGASDEGLDRALNATSSLAVVSSALNKSTQALGQEYAFMVEGQLKMRGQLFQLLQTTGIFGSETKKAGEAWAKLTEPKRIELLEYGLAKAAGNLEKAAPTMGDLLTKVDTMATLVSEKFGEGLIEEVSPAFEELIDELAGGRGEIEKNADAMGRQVGRLIREAAKDVREALRYVRENFADMKEAISKGFAYAKSVVQWILEHKGEIAIAFGAKTAAGASKGFLESSTFKTGSSIVKGAAKLGEEIAPGLQAGALGSTVGNLTTVLGGATVGIAALAAGVVVLGGAAYAASKIIEDQNADTANRIAAMKNIEEAALAGDVQRTRDLVSAMTLLGTSTNSLGQAIGQLDERTVRYYQSLEGIAAATNAAQQIDADGVKRQIELATRGIADAYARGSTDTTKAGQDYAANMYANQSAVLVDAYNQASKSGNSALAFLAAQALASSKGTQQAFLAAGQEVEGGFAALADVLIAGGSQYADFAAKLRSIKPKEAASPAAPTLNIGSATFNIRQDFRDADPDRILVLFRKDMLKAAQRRYTTSTGSVFGT